MEHVTEGCLCEGKICKMCQENKCIGHFPPYRKGKPALKLHCRNCETKRKMAWAREHPERMKEAQKRFKAKRKDLPPESKRKYQLTEKSKLATKRWQQSHPEKARAYRAKWNATYPEKAKMYLRRWQKGVGKTRVIEHRRKYRETHREEIRNAFEKWRYENPEYYRGLRRTLDARRRVRKAKAEGRHTVTEWLSLIRFYDYTCLCCGKREPEIRLTADHVIPLTRGGTDYIENIQPLCRPCNSRKGQKIIDFRPKTP